MSAVEIAISLVAGALILTLLVSATLNPALRRLAFRNAIRWPGSTALVIAGSMVGTAMIAGSLVVYDTTREGSHDLMRRHLGEIDLIVTLPDPQRDGHAYFDSGIVDRVSPEQINAELDRAGSDASVSGVLPALQSRVAGQSLDADSGEVMRVAPQIMVLSIGWDQLARFGDEPQAIPQPEPGGMVASEELAESLDLAVGDRIEVFVGEQPAALVVEHIVPTEGIAGLRELVFNPDRGTALVNLDDGQRLFANGQPLLNTVFVSNTGPVTESYQHSPDVQAAVGNLLHGADQRGAFLAFDIKAEVMEPTEFGLMFVVMSSFVILAGILLLVNIYVMLAEERRGTMGTIRALGMRRGHLVRLFLYEGFVYSAIAALLGVLIGLGMARIAVAWINHILVDYGVASLSFSVAVLPGTVLVAGLVGILLACGTIFVTSLRTSHLNIVSAIRGQDDPPRLTRSWWSVVWPPLMVLAGGAISLLAASADSGVAWLLGPSLLIIGTGFSLRSLVPARVILTTAFVGAIVYLWLGFQFIPAVEDELASGPQPIIVFSLVLMFAAIGLVSLNLSVIVTPISWISTRLRRLLPAARMALAYPGARPMRTSLTILMFTVVVFLVTFGQVMLTNFERNFLVAEVMEEVELGGFSAVAMMNPSSPVAELDERIDSLEVPEFGEIEAVSSLYSGRMHLPDFRQGDFIGTGDRDTTDLDGPLREQVVGVDAVFLQRAETRLVERAPEYSSDAEVWQALADDPTLIVGSTRYLGGQHWSRNRPRVEPGDTLMLENPSNGAVHETRMVGIFDEQMIPMSPIDGILINSAALTSGFDAGVVTPSWYLIALDPDAEHRAVADVLEREFVANGLVVEVVRDWLGLPFWLRLMHVIGAFIYFGLFVGIAGLAIISARAVHQRKRDIGTLRALGFRRGMIAGYLMGEAVLVAVIGVLLGIGCGLLAGYGFYLDEVGDYPDATFYFPLSGMAWTTGAILLAALVFTVGPALRASRLSVVEALRPME